MDVESIIIAVASPPGRSLHGIVRLSGAGSIELLARHVGTAVDRSRHTCSLLCPIGSHEVPATAIIFPGPNAYTGEDSVELLLPGHPTLLSRAMTAVLETATRHDRLARPAGPGEFTARAWLNGRLTLTQAEGVAALIASRSDAELRAAQMLLGPGLGRDAHRWADELAGVLALVEAGIDFTDQEDVIPIAPEQLAQHLDALHTAITAVVTHAVGREQLEAIPWVVLRGEPNAGKSSLFNALLGRERAVVTPVAGTTRDLLAEPLSIETPSGTAEIILVDVAGTGEAESTLSQLMQEAAGDASRRADLVLLCVPAGPDAVATSTMPPASTMVVRTKSDDAAERFDSSHLEVSAHSSAGLDELRHAIAARLSSRAVSLGADAVVLQPRHESAMRRALDHVAAARAIVDSSGRNAIEEPELVAASLRAALDELAILAGVVSPDDVLGRIFATFCVGK